MLLEDMTLELEALFWALVQNFVYIWLALS